MANRCAIITGATRGIGRGLFRRMNGLGINVATVYHRDIASAETFEQEAESAGIKYHIERLDICDFDGLKGFVEAVYQSFGSIDYLVNSVGIDYAATIFDTDLEDWRRSQDIMLNAPFVMSKLVLPTMRKQRFGRIVNIGASSKDYFKGVAGLGPFGIHKAALAVLTKTLAVEEIRNGITVNMVAPGSTRGAGTLPEEQRIPVSQIPLGRRVEIEEVVDAIMYFLSDSAGSVTGQFLGINGGLST
jgi:3-oxoacyl-[acyl-carrier protein] reductase